MRFSSYDKLRAFDVVARHSSIAVAAEVLHLSKGAVSYQVSRLEADLGFALFVREHRGLTLTARGRALWRVAKAAFDDIDSEIARLRNQGTARITIGMSTYFASRWLSPRLMHFMVEHPRIALRLQPMIGLIDPRGETIDMAVRWGRGEWTDVDSERLFACAAKPMAGLVVARRIEAIGMRAALPEVTLPHDRDGSEAWADWHARAGLPYASARDDLVIADPNVRVQAVIDGQGMALNDALVADEVAAGRLFQVSDVEMPEYGYYLACARGALADPALKCFRDWVVAAAAEYQAALS